MHGLLSRAVPGTSSSAWPARLEFETDQPTDDINCLMSDGTRVYLSAKRTCGMDVHLRSTVEQWVAQAPALAGGDRLVLAVAEPRGPVRNLGTALEKYRSHAAGYSSDEQAAMKALVDLIGGEPDSVRRQVLGAACVIEVDARKPGANQFDIVAAMLDAALVPVGEGVRAVQALSQSLHTTAGEASASDLDVWVGVLVDAGVEVYSDGSGVAGAAARARQLALGAYRGRLREQEGVVDLSLLADDLPSLVVPDLANGLRAAVSEDDEAGSDEFLLLARRWPRMLLVGLPGMGKSLALRQLAARWAADERAVLPVLVALRSVARRCESSSAVTLDLLCEIAAENASVGDRPVLVAAVREACLGGEAVLLLDGLDECLERSALVAEGVRRLLAEVVPEDTGVVLSTRSSGVAAARRLSLPVARLVPPQNLDSVMHKLLEHCATWRVGDADRRPSWIEARRRRNDEMRAEHRDLAAVPLLATLLGLIVADSVETSSPRNRTRLLADAVRHSVDRWEQRRTASAPTSDQLLDGYAVLGHLLSVSPEASVDDAARHVARMLGERWGMKPGPAEEATRRILTFWDSDVGVFISDDHGTLTARSRVFSEIGAAMRARHLSGADLAEWVTRCLSERDGHSALSLAIQLDERVIAELLRTADAPFADERRAVAVNGLGEGLELGGNEASVLFEMLISAVHKGGWAAVLELAAIRLPVALRQRRSDLIAALDLGPEERMIAVACEVLANAEGDGRFVDPSDETSVRAVLALPLPEHEVSIRKLSRRKYALETGERLREGRVEVALSAARHLAELDAETARRIHDTARFGTPGSHLLASSVLAERGHRFPSTLVQDLVASLATIEGTSKAVDRLAFLASFARLSDNDAGMSVAERWRLPDLGWLCGVIELRKTNVQALADVNEDDLLLRDEWARVVTRAAGLDPHRIAAQARVALDNREQDGLSGVIRLLSVTQPPDTAPVVVDGLSDQDTATLAQAVGSVSDLISSSAFGLLWQFHPKSTQERLLEVLPRFSPQRRFKAALLATCAADAPVAAARESIAGADPAVRVGVATCIGIMIDPTEEALALRAELWLDNDLSVRVAARMPSEEADVGPAATHWSCRLCAGRNELAEVDCQSCDRGERPE
ncbi:NACHT domain-containing protein [Lentzea sp. NPDC058436]|uniref:NACHT domain-containing protein n=1 Tax=Lentzea sp. NPDC058436 TaxID=3346499 RepID=UPI0036514D05